jgi:hypothetical protein
MKIIFLLISICLIKFGTAQSQFKKFDTQHSYKGVKFGISPKEVKKSIKVMESIDNSEWYSIEDGKYKSWAMMSFDEGWISFKNNRFSTILLQKYDKGDYSSYNEILFSVKKLFGEPNEPYDIKPGFVWKGKNITLIVGKEETVAKPYTIIVIRSEIYANPKNDL